MKGSFKENNWQPSTHPNLLWACAVENIVPDSKSVSVLGDPLSLDPIALERSSTTGEGDVCFQTFPSVRVNYVY